MPSSAPAPSRRSRPRRSTASPARASTCAAGPAATSSSRRWRGGCSGTWRGARCSPAPSRWCGLDFCRVTRPCPSSPAPSDRHLHLAGAARPEGGGGLLTSRGGKVARLHLSVMIAMTRGGVCHTPYLLAASIPPSPPLSNPNRVTHTRAHTHI
jgi:hypothetical protein